MSKIKDEVQEAMILRQPEFIGNMPGPDKMVFQLQQMMFVKRLPFKKTIVFDMDETLIRAQTKDLGDNCSIQINVDNQSLYVATRPHLKEVIENLSKHFELILFTAGSQKYANVIINVLLFQNIIKEDTFALTLTRNECFEVPEKKVYIKDLAKLLSNRSLEDIVIVDNKVQSYTLHLENGIPISDFKGDQSDCMLKELESFLMTYVLNCDDVRTVIRERFHNSVKLQRAEPGTGCE